MSEKKHMSKIKHGRGTRDWGKPVGYWCPRCGPVRDLLAPTATPGCCEEPIPVFAPIDEGERPEAVEPDDEAVCLGVWDRRFDERDLGFDLRLARHYATEGLGPGHRFANGYTFGWSLCVMTEGPQAERATIADAVLWVACWTLP